MDTVRPNKTKNPQITCNAQGATYFDFLITLKDNTPLQGLHFIAFATDELGLTANTTLGEESFHALHNDSEHNWYMVMLAYAYTKIYKKICYIHQAQPNTVAALAFAEQAQKLIKLTFFGNNVSLHAGPEEWALLTSYITTPVTH